MYHHKNKKQEDQDVRVPQLFKQHLESKNDYEQIMVHAPDKITSKETLMHTTTNEPFMPARLYFKFINRKKLLKALERRKCIDRHDENTFIITYEEEAKNVNLDVACDEVPEELFPIILAKAQIVSSSEIHVDVRSFKRAMEIIKFLYKYVGPEFLYLTHVATYNRFIKVTSDNIQGLMNLDYDALFSKENLQNGGFAWNEIVDKTTGDVCKIESSENSDINTVPIVKKIPISGTKPELSRLQFILNLNMAVAHEHLKGNTSCTVGDIINKAIYAPIEKNRQE